MILNELYISNMHIVDEPYSNTFVVLVPQSYYHLYYLAATSHLMPAAGALSHDIPQPQSPLPGR
jgi:hypothetical protein